MDPGICKICFGLDDAQARKFMWEKYWVSGNTFSTGFRKECLVKSVQDGCRGCRALLGGLDLADPCHQQMSAEASYHLLFDRDLPLRIEYSTANNSTSQVEFFTIDEELRKPWSCIGVASKIQSAPTLGTVSQLALGWVAKCAEVHEACKRAESTSLPMRVIDIGPSPESVPRLSISNGNTAPYVAVSYCWGAQGDNLTTTLETLTTRLEGIPWDKIPNTLQQAMRLTQLLGIRYIWIDSLCIIQNDGPDWRYHASQMASIYENAWIVLSATASSAVHGGLIANRNEALAAFRSHELWTADSQGQKLRVYVRKRLPHSNIIPEVVYPENQCPLLTRGWAFQERMLATRILHFLPEELLWECRSEYWCECMSSQADLVWNEGGLRSSAYSRAMADPSTVDLNALWRTIISNYSHRQFSQYKDRLPALWGIARKFQDTGMRGYCAGLWSSDLAISLMWETKGSNTTDYPVSSCDHTPVVPPPSWSWASTPFPVEWAVHELKSANLEAKVVGTNWGDARVADHRNLNDTIKLEAQVTAAPIDARLSVLWKVSNADLMENKNSTDPTIIRGRREATLYPDVPFEELPIQLLPFSTAKRVADGQLVTIALMFSYKKRAEGYLHRAHTFDVDAEVTYWYGLVLTESVRVPGAYERIGVVKGRFIGYYSSGWFSGIERSTISII